MKKLNKILLMIITLSIATIYGQASDINLSIKKIHSYKINVNAQEKVVVGDNKINVKITHKGHVVHDARVIFSVYESDDNILEYKSSKTDKNGNYAFDIKVPENSKFIYTVSFNRNGGVIRKLNNSIKL